MRCMLSLLSLWWTLSAAEEQEARIIAGSLAQEGDFPWMVALLYDANASSTSKVENVFCGGTLIEEDWVRHR